METTDGKRASSLSDDLGIEGVVLGIARDLSELRNGKISVQDAHARAELAKQYMNGIRMIVNAQKFLLERSRHIGKAV
tara:strand:- start:1165 stop:1398 length:234 start_codon:yes stop_codon:yes gene_type:complete